MTRACYIYKWIFSGRCMLGFALYCTLVLDSLAQAKFECITGRWNPALIAVLCCCFFHMLKVLTLPVVPSLLKVHVLHLPCTSVAIVDLHRGSYTHTHIHVCLAATVYVVLYTCKCNSVLGMLASVHVRVCLKGSVLITHFLSFGVVTSPQRVHHQSRDTRATEESWQVSFGSSWMSLSVCTCLSSQ